MTISNQHCLPANQWMPCNIINMRLMRKADRFFRVPLLTVSRLLLPPCSNTLARHLQFLRTHTKRYFIFFTLQIRDLSRDNIHLQRQVIVIEPRVILKGNHSPILPSEEKMQHMTNNTETNCTGKWKSCNSALLAINETPCTFAERKLIFKLTHMGIGVLVIFSSVRIAHTEFVRYPLEGHLQTIMLYLASVIQRLPEETFQQLFYNITKSLIAHYRNTYRKEVERLPGTFRVWFESCEKAPAAFGFRILVL